MFVKKAECLSKCKPAAEVSQAELITLRLEFCRAPMSGRRSKFVAPSLRCQSYRGAGTGTAGPPTVPPLSQTFTVFMALSASTREV